MAPNLSVKIITNDFINNVRVISVRSKEIQAEANLRINGLKKKMTYKSRTDTENKSKFMQTCWEDGQIDKNIILACIKKSEQCFSARKTC